MVKIPDIYTEDEFTNIVNLLNKLPLDLSLSRKEKKESQENQSYLCYKIKFLRLLKIILKKNSFVVLGWKIEQIIQSYYLPSHIGVSKLQPKIEEKYAG